MSSLNRPVAPAEQHEGTVTNAASNEPPLVSVLTPSFNQARWLRDNMRSVDGQTHPRVEHIVADGGSTDASLEILREAPPDVKWISEPDRGQSHAINKAFARSSGAIIGWLNSDDAYFSKRAIADAVEVFAHRPEVGVVYGHAALVNASGELLYTLWAPPKATLILRRFNVLYQPSVFVRRAIIGRSWLVDPNLHYMMDRDLWLYLAGRTHFARLDRIIAIDRHQLERKSYTMLDVAAHDFAILRDRYRLPRLAANRLWRRCIKVALRTAGTTKLAEARRGSDLLRIEVPKSSVLLLRQVAQLRRWMPAGDQ